MQLFLLISLSTTLALAGAFSFVKEGCIRLTTRINIENRYTDNRGQLRSATYMVPQTAKVNATCKNRALSKRVAKITIKFGNDVIHLNFSAPTFFGKTISLRGVSYKYEQDDTRFPQGGTSAINQVEKAFAEDDFPIGAWEKKYVCTSLPVNLGGGLVIDFRDLSLDLFSSTSTAEEQCQIPSSSTTTTSARPSHVTKRPHHRLTTVPSLTTFPSLP